MWLRVNGIVVMLRKQHNKSLIYPNHFLFFYIYQTIFVHREKDKKYSNESNIVNPQYICLTYPNHFCLSRNAKKNWMKPWSYPFICICRLTFKWKSDKIFLDNNTPGMLLYKRLLLSVTIRCYRPLLHITVLMNEFESNLTHFGDCSVI